ncbi:MAG: hypothetical protein O2960_14150 [Verrucomicrobia bacterium]|nr:hypothetical protein [Verrucomicrobiota bacterium]
MSSDEPASDDQRAALRRMTPWQRWQAGRRFYWTLRRHKAAFLKSQHADWSDERIQTEVRRLFLYARS